MNVYIIAVFKSRTDAIRFYNEILKLTKIVFIINTPRNIINSCGISVKFKSQFFIKAKKIIKEGLFPSFYDFF